MNETPVSVRDYWTSYCELYIMDGVIFKCMRVMFVNIYVYFFFAKFNVFIELSLLFKIVVLPFIILSYPLISNLELFSLIIYFLLTPCVTHTRTFIC